MQERLQAVLNRLIDKWNSIERNQKIKIILISVSILLALFIAVFLMVRPSRVTIKAEDTVSAMEIKEVLSNEGIESTVEGSVVYLNEGDFNDAQYIIATSDRTSGKRFTYQDALDASTMGTTESTKRDLLIRAQQTRFEEILEKFDGVSSAAVNLNVADDSNFLIPESKSKASVSITTRNNAIIDPSVGEAMANVIRNGVSNLELEDVYITDTNGNVIYDGTSSGSTSAGSLRTRKDFEEYMSNKIKESVEDAVGERFDRVNAIVNLAFNWDVISEKSVTHVSPLGSDVSTGLVNEEKTSKSTYENAPVEGEPGLGENDMETPTYDMGTGENSSASITESQANYIHDTFERNIESEIGELLKGDSGVAVHVFNDRIYNQVEMTENGRLDGTDWQTFKTNTPIEEPFVLEDEYIESIRTGTGIENLVMLGFYKNTFVDETVEPINIRQIVVLAIVGLLILLLAYGLIRKTQPDEVTEIEPELSVEDLLVSSQLEEESEREEAEAEGMDEIEFGPESQVMRQINNFVDEKPDSVANLLRNWINEDWE